MGANTGWGQGKECVCNKLNIMGLPLISLASQSIKYIHIFKKNFEHLTCWKGEEKRSHDIHR